MKINLGKREYRDDFEWHDIFAWWPHRVESGELVWLEPIQRRWQTYSSSDLAATREYRLREAPNNI